MKAKNLGLAGVVCLMLALPIVALLDIRQSYESIWLLLVLSLVLGAAIPFGVAWLAAKTYLKRGSRAALLMGGGMLAFGLGMTLGSGEIAVAGSINAGVTAHNLCCLLGAMLNTAAGLVLLYPETVARDASGKEYTLLLSYCVIILFAALVTVAAATESIPPFYAPDGGPTIARQVVLGEAIILYAIAAGLFAGRYLSKRSDYAYWYALSLTLIAIGLSGVFLKTVMGSPLGWLGRISQYVGNLFALLAVLGAWKESTAKGWPLESVLESFFSDSELRYRKLVEGAPDPIVAFDQDRKIIAWNPAAAAVFGLSEESAIGMDFRRFVDANCQGTIERWIDDPKSRSAEILARKNGGETFPALFSCSVTSLDTGRVVTCVVSDIKDRKAAERAIADLNEDLAGRVVELSATLETVRSQNRLLEALERAHKRFMSAETRPEIFRNLLDDFLALTNSEIGFVGELLVTNEGVPFLRDHAISNVSWDEKSRNMRPRHAEYKSLDFKDIRGLWGDALLAAQPVISNDPEHDSRALGLPEGHPDISSFLGIPFVSDGEVVGMVGVANRPGGYDTGVTEWLQPYVTTCALLIRAIQSDSQRREAERRLVEAHEGLERTVRRRTVELLESNEKLEAMIRNLRVKTDELERFAYTVSHDLKSPLITIQSFAGIIIKELEKGGVPQALADARRVRDAAANMKLLLDGLLEFSRVGRMVSASSAIPFREVVEAALSGLQALISQSGARVVVADNFPSVVIDKVRMVQVLQNLVENACKFSGGADPPHIEIGSYNEDGRDVFYVKDHGIGIDPRHRERVFELFSQLNPSSSGTGLGLALVKKIIEQRHGQVWVRSNDNEPGCAFLFTLP